MEAWHSGFSEQDTQRAALCESVPLIDFLTSNNSQMCRVQISKVNLCHHQDIHLIKASGQWQCSMCTVIHGSVFTIGNLKFTCDAIQEGQYCLHSLYAKYMMTGAIVFDVKRTIGAIDDVSDVTLAEMFMETGRVLISHSFCLVLFTVWLSYKFKLSEMLCCISFTF